MAHWEHLVSQKINLDLFSINAAPGFVAKQSIREHINLSNRNSVPLLFVWHRLLFQILVIAALHGMHNFKPSHLSTLRVFHRKFRLPLSSQSFVIASRDADVIPKSKWSLNDIYISLNREYICSPINPLTGANVRKTLNINSERRADLVNSCTIRLESSVKLQGVPVLVVSASPISHQNIFYIVSSPR